VDDYVNDFAVVFADSGLDRRRGRVRLCQRLPAVEGNGDKRHDPSRLAVNA
jgi:hypothetical protein